jgi:two-component system OmpR family sensor kinase
LRIGNLLDRVSLRSKLTALAVTLIALLLAGSSISTVALLRTYLQSNTDTLLTSTVSQLRNENPASLEFRMEAGLVNLPSLPSGYYIAFVDREGNLALGLVASGSEARVVPNVSGLDLAFVRSTQGIPFDVEVETESRDLEYRVVAEPLTRFQGSVVIALPVNENRRLIAEYSAIGGRVGLVILVLAGFSIWLTISSALRPLREVERTAKDIEQGNFEKRLIEKPENTEIGKLNKSLNSMLDGIETAFIARGKTLDQMRRFLSDASHELRTPLASVQGYAELYRMGAMKKKADVSEAMERIESEAKRMSGLVDNLLTLTRLDELKELEKTEADVLAIARSAVQDAQAANLDNDFEICDLAGADLSEAKQLRAEVDSNQIKQVFTNLLANAARFSPQDKPVSVSLGETDEGLVIRVIDRGEGIPEQFREKVFDRFYRVDNSRNNETGGSGLGLAIVKSIIDAHNGSIEIKETEGGGATFEIHIPITQVAQVTNS